MGSGTLLVAGAVLAAGSGSRMGGPKAGLELDGARLVDRAIAAMAAAGLDPLLAVVRPGTVVPGARLVVNPCPDDGQRSSLECAVSASERLDVAIDALAISLVDMPGVDAVAIGHVVRAWRPGRIAVARYAGRRGHPTVMAPALWRDALQLAAPDEGARALLASRPDLVDEIDVDGDPADLDTPEDVRRWTRRY